MNLNFIGDWMKNGKKPLFLTAAAVSLVTFIVYIGSLSGDFINYDDKAYLFENPVIRQLDLPSIISMFTSSHAGWWMPLTWLSFAIDYQLWGLNPVGFHFTNILIHTVNSALVVIIAARVIRLGAESDTDYASQLIFAAIAGLIWSLHPLRVESVAWIAERKDVLNGLFALLSIFFYLRGRNRQAEGASSGRDSFYSILFYYLSLGAKSVTVVLPVMLLALDLYPLRRLTLATFWQRVTEKILYLAGSAFVVLMTFVTAAKGNYLVSYEQFPFSQRLAVSGNALIEYLRLFLVPIDLSPLNVIPDPIPFSYTLKAVVALLLIIAVVCSRRGWLQSCCLCFLLPLLPVLAFFQNGDQAFADHFTYLPAVAPSIAVAVILLNLLQRFGKSNRVVLIAASFAIIALYSLLSVRMFPVWQSTETFWSRVIAVQPIAINFKERGRNYHLDGRYSKAVADFSAAIALIPETLRPYSYNFYAFRAESLRCAGLYAEAVWDFDAAIAMLPHPVYYHHRGLALQALGRLVEAEQDFRFGGTVTYPVVWFDREL